MTEIAEATIIAAARVAGRDSSFQKVLDDAAEIRARGGQLVRFILTDDGRLAAQEGILISGGVPK